MNASFDPSTYRIRAYQGSDEAALLDLWNAALRADRINAATLRTKVLLDLNFHSDGLLLAEGDQGLLGFVLSITRRVPQFLDGLEPQRAWITAFGVHPDARRRGIGSALFHAAQARLAADGRTEVLLSPYTPNYFTPGVDVDAYPQALPFLQTLGWQVTSRPISMRAETTGFQIPPELLAHQRSLQAQGFVVRPVTSADLAELMPFIARHFGWDWVRFAQDYLLELFGPGSDQVCFLVATHHSQIVGYCQQRRERFGPFGVDPALRGQGLGRALLFHCLADMRTKGFHCAWFLWTGADAARLYALAGFHPARQFAVLRRAL